MNLIITRPEGLYCPPGELYIDPWRPVERAVITHGQISVMVRCLRERGLDAQSFATEYGEEEAESPAHTECGDASLDPEKPT